MQIDRDSNRILLQMLAEIEVFSTIDDLLFETKHPYVPSVRRLGIPYRPAAWFGDPLSGTRRKAISRAAMKLAVWGFIERRTQNRRDRVTHLRLTPTGFRRAFHLADKIDLRQLAQSLARIDWAEGLGKELDDLAPNAEPGQSMLDVPPRLR